MKDKILNLMFKRLQHFIPMLLCLTIAFFFVKFIRTGELCWFFLTILTPYLVPLILYRVVIGIYPMKEGGSYMGLSEKKFNPWLFSLRIQQIYIICPQLERALFFFPRTYSMWLRAWGSKIGKSVFWAPGVVINDRGLVEVGDYVVFGHQAYMSSHLVRMKNGKYFVFVKKVKIGSHAFIGAFSKLGPGTTIAPSSIVPAMSAFSVNKEFSSTEKDS